MASRVLNKMEKNYNIFLPYLVQLSNFLSNFVNNSVCGYNDILSIFAEQKQKCCQSLTEQLHPKQLCFCLSLFIQIYSLELVLPLPLDEILSTSHYS